MRRFWVLMLFGGKKVPTSKQMKTIDKLGLETPYLLTKKKASELIQKELDNRKWAEKRRIMMEEKKRQAHHEEQMDLMRRAEREVEDRWQVRSQVKQWRIEEEAARELEEIKRNAARREFKKKYTRKR